MAISAVTTYNQFEGLMLSTANRQWDDPTAGNIMYILASATYTPSVSDTTAAAIGANVIASGDGAPIAAASLAVDATTTPGSALLKSADAAFGAAVTITAKYLVAVQPVTPGTYASTAKLLWYVDLDDTSTASTVSSTTSTFSINQPAAGWVSIG